MKIGVLTYYKTLNFGVNMQGIAVYQLARKAFPNAIVELIDLKDEWWTRLLLPYKSETNLKGLCFDLKRIAKYRRIRKLVRFSERKLITRDYRKASSFLSHQQYDIILVGSDTLLRFKPFHKGRNLSYYWLNSTIKAKKFFIAASAASLSVEELDEWQKAKLKENLEGFSLMGVRDEATFELMNRLNPANKGLLAIIPDPTFAYDIDYSHADNYMKRRGLNKSQKLVLFHLLKKEPWAGVLAAKLRDRGWAIASLRPALYADICLNDIGPFEEAGVFRYFDFVVTNRFHDSVFCFKNFTPVITYYSNKKHSNRRGESKYTNLFRYFGLEGTSLLQRDNNLNADDFTRAIESTLRSFNKQQVETKLEELKTQVLDYMARVKKIAINKNTTRS